MDSLMDSDLYKLLDVPEVASLQEIKKAYRKKALSCHPDKNPDNPRAAELFHELSRALEILTDTSARAAYDKVITAKRQAKLRAKVFDSKRKKLKEDLEAREEAYKRSLNATHATKSEEEKLQEEIERLRKEGSKQVEEEIAFVERQIKKRILKFCNKPSTANGSYKIKIKWRNKNSDETKYDYDTLHRILSKYGDITALVISSTKEGSALVEFQNERDAEIAVKTEIGFVQNPLTLKKLWKPEEITNPDADVTDHRQPCDLQTSSVDNNKGERENNRTQNNLGKSNRDRCVDSRIKQHQVSDAEFEISVLNNLRRAEERKRSLKTESAEENT